MYLRFARRIKDGKEHRYWSIAESKRCAGGKVVQRPVLYLGEINDSQLAAWCRVIEALVVVCVPQFWPPQEMRLDWFGDRSRLAKCCSPRLIPLVLRTVLRVAYAQESLVYAPNFCRPGG
jgi:hypothetical protein